MEPVFWGSLALICYLIYKLGTSRHDFWRKKNVPFLKPVPFLGNFWPLVLQLKSDTESVRDLYNSFEKGRFGGLWLFSQPILMIRDPDLIKAITIKDFDHFMNRNTIVDDELDPIFAKNLLSIRDEKWKNMRNILTPTFTSAKMKNMFHLMNQCAKNMVEKISEDLKKQTAEGHRDVLHLEMKNFATLFTNDVISTCAFGLEVNSFKNPKNEFYNAVQQISNFSGRKFLALIFRFVAPYLSQKLKVSLFPEPTVQFFRDLVWGSIREREEKNIVRQDMIHLLMQAKNRLQADGTERDGAVLEGDDLTAQVVLFLFAGFDTSSTFLSFTSYELALNKDIQTKLQEEIDRVVAEDGGELTYDGVSTKMVYLNMVVNESLRKWPPINGVDRVVSHRYVIPAEGDQSQVTLEKGDLIMLSIQGLHNDPKYFPVPEKFDPERFSEENKDKIVPFSFIPFGSGPRHCIGMRFALMEGKVCLVNLLRRFTVEVVPETQIPLRLKKGSFSKLAEKGIWVGLKPRHH